MIRKTALTIICLAALLLMPFCAYASNTIYVAGNPDMYPVEYYDEQEEKYKGVLPEIYKDISAGGEAKLVYLKPSSKNNQRRLAKNKQVDIVSAHKKSDIKGIAEEITIVTVDNQEICIGFTGIATNETKTLVKNYLAEVNDSRLLSLTLENSEQKSDFKIAYVLIATLLILAAVITALVIIVAKNRKKAKIDSISKMTDELTGIGNMQYFEYCCKKYITSTQSSLYYAAYISVDISLIKKFASQKKVEEVQLFAANAISSYAGDNDFFARISEGTFALCYQSLSREKAQEYISSLLKILNDTEKELFERYKISFHAGVYPLDNAGVSAQTLLLYASYGYNSAFEQRTPYVFSDNELLNTEKFKNRLQNDLINAIKNEEFCPYMQFIVETKTKKLYGAEILARWNNPRDGILAPRDFIESLKNAKIVDELDFFIFEKCCGFLQNWNTDNELNISCNFTRFTVSQNNFQKRIEEIISKYSFDRKRLLIELTEDSLEDDKTVAFENIMFCKKSGFKIGLDDFGAGYTSLNDLCNYPIDVIKIDRSIISKSVTEKGTALLNGVVKLAHSLGIKVLCEGVETKEENEVSVSSGCDFIQGFYYSRVFPYEEAIKIYINNKN